VLAVALASVALAVALPFKIWLAQREQIDGLRQQTKAQEQRVAQLQHQQQQWQDPTYVEQQARVRLHYVKPGEKAYIVIGPPTPAPRSPGRSPAAGTASPGATLSGPWYSRMWQTVQIAGGPVASGAATSHK
jgi:cell division protein FtsB